MPTDLFDFTQIDNDTPGVAWLATTTSIFNALGWVEIVDSSEDEARATEQIDTAYIVNGDTAYLNNLRLLSVANGDIILLFLGDTTTSSGGSDGPSFTAAALDTLGLAVQRGANTYKFLLADLVANASDNDDTEPYQWDNIDPPLTTAILQALTGAGVKSLLVDTANPHIDWTNLSLRDLPDAPAAPTVTSAGTTSLRATWAAPAAGATPTGYDLRWRQSPSGAWTQVDDVASPHTITGLSAGTAYEAQVRAYADEGDGPWSAGATATTDGTDLMPAIATIADVTVLQGETLDLTLPDPGGNAPVTLTVSGRPAWIRFNPATRELTGAAPNSAAAIELTYTATDADGDSASRTFNVLVPLELANFSAPAGRASAAAGLLTRGAANATDFLYRDDDPAAAETSDVGALLAGSLTPDSQRISRIRRFDATHFQLIDTPDNTDIGAYFGSGGAGNDLRIHIQDRDGTAAFDAAAVTISQSNASIVRFAAPAAFMTVVDRIAADQRFILAFTRATDDLDVSAAPGLAGGRLSLQASPALEDPENLPLSAAPAIGGALSLQASPTLETSNDLPVTAAPGLTGGQLRLQASPTLTGGIAPTLPALTDYNVEQGDTLDITLDPATGGAAPYAYALTGLPAGLVFDPAARTISGAVPALPGDYALTYTVTDADGDSDSRAFTLRILLALANFNAPAGHDPISAALFERGPDNNANWWYRADDGTGALLAGTAEVEPGYPYSRVRRPTQGSFQINDNPDTRNLRQFFGNNGPGRAYTIHVQTAASAVSFTHIGTPIFAGANYMQWIPPVVTTSLLDTIAAGDRFILAFTRGPVTLSAAPAIGGALSLQASPALADADPLPVTAAPGLAGGQLSVQARPTIADPEDLQLTAAPAVGGALSVEASPVLADADPLPVTARPGLAGGQLSVQARPTAISPPDLDLAARPRLAGGRLSAEAVPTLTGGALPTPDPVALLLSLETDTGDGLAHGFPPRIALHGDVVMQAWMPAEAAVETRLLRAASDVAGPAVHGRVRTLVEETITLLTPDAAIAEQTARLLNALNAGRASAWLHVQRLGAADVWRTPLRGGSLQLDGDSLHFGGGKRRYRLRIIREPYFEAAAAPTPLGSFPLRSRAPIVIDAPATGTLAAPLQLTVQTATALAATRLHLFQDRNVPPSWTPAYVMAATGTAAGTGGHAQIRFDNPAPNGKGGPPQLHQPLLAPAGAASAAVVRTRRNGDALGLGYGRAAMDLNDETELAALGRLGGQDSVFSGFGIARVDDDVDHYLVTSYAGRISGSGWRLVNAPADGYLAAEFSAGLSGARALRGGRGGLALHGGPLLAAPAQRVVILPLIETLGASAAEYDGNALTLTAAVRPRVSEIL